MMKLFFIPALFILSCGSVRTNNPVVSADSIVVSENAAKEGLIPSIKLPVCINSKIDSFKLKEQYEKPQRVEQYIYKGKEVYYVVMPCCDYFNEVFDSACKFLGSPDGGFTGKGDGRLPGFFSEATNKKVVWEPAK